MRILFIILSAAVLMNTSSSCKSSSGPKPFCDTVCLKDSLKFSGNHPLEPYVYISASNCNADTLIWSFKGMGTNRKMGLADLLKTQVKINKDKISCFIKDTAYAWLMFNDCATGRGYQMKIPYNKTARFGLKSSGINWFDPKFSVAENLVVNTDRGNIFVEDRETGKKAMMTFGKKIDIDYDFIHDYIDSVNISSSRIWVRIKMDNEWKELTKEISLQ